MSLFVHQLNADSSFLLTFAPPFASEKHARRLPGSYTILIDPWLEGSSSILHPRFQVSHHAHESSIRSLRELSELPDLIVVSQDKPDHCHKETLCTLPKDTRVRIVATPAAAKKIRSWKHFNPHSIIALEPYEVRSEASIFKVPLAPFSTSSAPGEITIANVVQKYDVTNLHNAIGVTYKSPGTKLMTRHGSYVDLAQMAMMSPPATPRPSTASGTGSTASLRHRRGPSVLDPTPLRGEAAAWSLTPPDTPEFSDTFAEQYLDQPAQATNPTQATMSLQTKDKPLSVIYSPHGISYSALEPYVETHLRSTEALPLDVLFHSMNVEKNPWFMGGTVATGAPGGLPIARYLDAKHWISAHDEIKDNRGVAVVMIKSRCFDVGDVQDMLKEGKGGDFNKTQVHVLRSGGKVKLP